MANVKYLIFFLKQKVFSVQRKLIGDFLDNSQQAAIRSISFLFFLNFFVNSWRIARMTEQLE
jgi:hypothetical protein